MIIEREAAARARRREAAILRARVPSGSFSHLSGKRFAAPEQYVSEYCWLRIEQPDVMMGVF